MNKKEIAKSEKLLRTLGFNEKQIKTIIKKAGKNTTAADLTTLVLWVWAFSVAFTLAEIVGLPKEITINRVMKFLKKYQNQERR